MHSDLSPITVFATDVTVAIGLCPHRRSHRVDRVVCIFVLDDFEVSSSSLH